MVTNACMSDGCSHQFIAVSRRKLANHFGGWQGQRPAAFHTQVTENKHMTPEAIYNLIVGEKEEYFGVAKEKVIQYIEAIKAKLDLIANQVYTVRNLILNLVFKLLLGSSKPTKRD
jgi:type 1 glutamine amidotransferase